MEEQLHGDYHEAPEFDAAADYVAGLASREDCPLPPASLLQLYGLYKQATVGDCTGDKPSIFHPSARAKWAAWKQVQGLSAGLARSEYVTLLRQLQPEWTPGRPGAADKQGVGPVFSSLAPVEDEEHEGTTPQMDTAAHPLHSAASSGDEQLVQQLLATGTDVGCRDDEGCSPLHWAADKGHVKVIRILLQKGADPNSLDIDGFTPLHYAALAEQREAAEVLLQSGADASIRSSDGETAKDIAPPDWTFLA